MDHDRSLETIRKLQRLLDEAFRVPGTNIRFGWDPIVGLVPWLGDLLTALASGAIVMHARKVGVPRVVQLRMLMNIGLDIAIGVVPIAGDLADVFWKSNTRNLALLERHAGAARPPSIGDWVFVIGVIVAVVAMALVPVFVLYWVIHQRGLW